MSMSDAKGLVRRFYREVINDRNVDAIDTLLSADFVHNGEHRGREGQKQVVGAFLAGFSDLQNEIEIILGEGDLIAAHQTWTGTHDGEFAGIAPSGKRVSFVSTAILRVVDGEIAEATDVVDLSGLQG